MIAGRITKGKARTNWSKYSSAITANGVGLKNWWWDLCIFQQASIVWPIRW